MATRTQIDKFIDRYKGDIDTAQATYLSTHSKYRQYLRGEFNESVEVHEYVRPDGGVGYVIYVYAVEGSDTYAKSYTYGTEPIIPIHNWTKIVPGEI